MSAALGLRPYLKTVKLRTANIPRGMAVSRDSAVPGHRPYPSLAGLLRLPLSCSRDRNLNVSQASCMVTDKPQKPQGGGQIGCGWGGQASARD